MMNREDFENLLIKIASYEDDPKVSNEINSALKRLKQNPEIFSGNPDGDFTYEDPVLANAVYFFKQSESIPILTATGEESERISILTASADNMDGLLHNGRIIEWLSAGLRAYINHGDESFNDLENRIPDHSIKIETKNIRLALVGDGGFNSPIQQKVLSKVREIHKENPFDFLIHLGDIYFAGGYQSVLEHFLAPFQQAGPKVLTLLGNHELYMGGKPVSAMLDVLKQPGRYFSIENRDWVIACLDTALPAKNFLRNEGELDKDQLSWLEELVCNTEKRVILLSHHYIESSWGGISPILKNQIETLLPKIFSWYWGHEHSCVFYKKETIGFNGACIGNGSFLEKWKKPKAENKSEWYAKGRCKCIKTKKHFWEHGFLELELNPTKLVETYHLESETKERAINVR